MKNENNVEWWVRSTSDVCSFFDISPKTLNNWEKKGAPKKDYGKWDIKELIEWKYGAGKNQSPEARKLLAEADLKEAKAEIEKIKLAIAEGRYIESKKITSDLRRLFTVLKKSLIGIGHAVGSELNSLDPECAQIAINVIDEKIHEALEQLSKSGIYGKK